MRTTARRGFFAAALTAIAMLGLSASNADAGYTIKLFREFSGSGTPNSSAGNPYATIDFEQVGADVVVTAKALTSSSSYGKITGLYFNLRVNNAGWTAATSSLSMTGVSLALTDIKFNDRDNPTGDTTFKADGDGFFDVFIDLPTAGGPSSPSFNAGDEFSFKLVGANLAWVIDVSKGGPVGKNGFVGAAHIQGFAGDKSGWYTGGIYDGDDEINPLGDLEEAPAPPAVVLAVMGVGLFGFVGRRLRRPAVA